MELTKDTRLCLTTDYRVDYKKHGAVKCVFVVYIPRMNGIVECMGNELFNR